MVAKTKSKRNAIRKRFMEASIEEQLPPPRPVAERPISETGVKYLLGYARTSVGGGEQNPQMQITALEQAGCQKIFHEAKSGGRWDRPELHRMLEHLRPGDVIVVWKLDRLSRSLMDLLKIMDTVDQAGAGFRSLTEAIDTTTPAGRMMMQMVGSFAEFERAMIRERTVAGLVQARSEGRFGGRPPKLDMQKRQMVADLVISGSRTGADMARMFDVSETMVSRIVAQARAAVTRQPTGRLPS